MTNEKLLEVALCGYLPYGVGMKNQFGKTKRKEVEILTHDNYLELVKTRRRKPMLHPMSCLIKPITVPNYNDGKEFVPMRELGKIERVKNPKNWISVLTSDEIDAVFDFTILQYTMEEQLIPVWMADILNQWLIDWRDLIGKGLAISID